MRKLARELARALGLTLREEWNARAGDRLPAFHELRPLFERELRRARRYERPLSILVLRFDRTLDRAQREHRVSQLESLLQDALRETDLVGYMADKSEFAALLPEADVSTALQGAKRIRQLWRERDSVGLDAGAATYPADGLTLDDLLAHARQSSLRLPVGLNGRRQRMRSAAGA